MKVEYSKATRSDPDGFMEMDLSSVPYSRAGSYMAISELSADYRGLGNAPGLYLRTVHGSAGSPLVARLEVAEYAAGLVGASLRLSNGRGGIELCFDDCDTLLIRGGAGASLTLDFLTGSGPYDYIYSFERDGRRFYMANCYKNNCRYLMRCEAGEAALEQVWEESSALYSRLTFSGQRGFLLALREIEREWDGSWKDYDFDACRAGTDADFEAFRAGMPEVPGEYARAARLAAYVNWASVVRRDGFLSRDAMLMSKNWMTSVWSWDHCFNAIALSFHLPEMAWDQFMLMFDFQDRTGLLPDSVNDAHVVWNYCKPPVHGWALRWMMRNMALCREQLAEAYDRLSRWTDWWLGCRDYDGDGLCEYNHGNDSGWDNSTAFSALPPTATPELQAFLVIQMDVLSDLANRLERPEDAVNWRERAGSMLNTLVERLFRDGLPIVRQSGSGEIVENDSLLPYISVVLGERLPEAIRRRMVEVLSGGKFRTDHGFATESPRSPFYRDDGYWRGPIWAPSTMLLLDGLNGCGQHALVREIARRFADMASRSGFAENYDARTGVGQRDRAYTWTASAFLAMAHEYLMDGD